MPFAAVDLASAEMHGQGSWRHEPPGIRNWSSPNERSRLPLEDALRSGSRGTCSPEVRGTRAATMSCSINSFPASSKPACLRRHNGLDVAIGIGMPEFLADGAGLFCMPRIGPEVESPDIRVGEPDRAVMIVILRAGMSHAVVSDSPEGPLKGKKNGRGYFSSKCQRSFSFPSMRKET